jgi:general secretion pathway protein D
MRPPGGVPPAATAAPQPVPPATARFAPPTLETTVNSSFPVALLLDGGADAISASPLQIQYDPKALSLIDVSPGDLFARGGAAPVFAKDIQNGQGLATIQIGRPAGVAGVAGPGTLITLNFRAIAPGSTTVRALNVTVRNSQALAIGSSSPQFSVNVKAADSNK